MLQRIVVVGASLAGLRAAETLRDRGFDGALTLIGDELHRPYDRPPLSKQVIQGPGSPNRPSSAGRTAMMRSLSTCVLARAMSVELRARRVMLAGGTFADYDRLIIATGARVHLPGIAPRAACSSCAVWTTRSRYGRN